MPTGRTHKLANFTKNTLFYCCKNGYCISLIKKVKGKIHNSLVKNIKLACLKLLQHKLVYIFY